jgi:hypothetical protein
MTTAVNPFQQGTEPPDPVAGELFEWGRAELEIETRAPAEQARRQLVTELSGYDFVPPARWQIAARSAAIRSPQVSSRETHGQFALGELEDRRREEVEAFAARFFAIPVGPRREHWNTCGPIMGRFPTILDPILGQTDNG